MLLRLPTGWVTHDHQIIQINWMLRIVGDQVCGGHEAIFQSGRKRVLGYEAILDVDDEHFRILGEQIGDRFEHVWAWIMNTKTNCNISE